MPDTRSDISEVLLIEVRTYLKTPKTQRVFALA
jgi:hypothetical protein